MEIKYLSASRMDTWVTCKYKYGCRYHKFHPEVVIDQAVHFKLGTAVHKALEFAGGLVKDKGLTSFSDDDIGAICLEYYKQAIKESLDDAVIREDGLNMLRNKLDNFDNPGDYVETEDGRRVDSTDLRIREKAVLEANEKWKNGEITSEQLENYWNSLTSAEIERLRQEAQARPGDVEERLVGRPAARDRNV